MATFNFNPRQPFFNAKKIKICISLILHIAFFNTLVDLTSKKEKSICRLLQKHQARTD